MSAKIFLLLCVLACHQDAIVSQTTPSPNCFNNNTNYETTSTPVCTYNGQKYELDAEVVIDPCNRGYCGSDGEFMFEITDCFQCLKTIPIPGECCSPCIPACEYAGKIYDEGSFTTGDPCEVCQCISNDGGGEVECYTLPCEPCLDYEDYVFVPGQCCPECRPSTPPPSHLDCYYNGQTYEPNDEIIIDLCNRGYCYSDGQVYFETTDCSTNCYKTEPVPGQCCSRCLPACVHEGQIYDEGPVPSSDPCQVCECPNNSGSGEVECYPLPCETCQSNEDSVIVPGQCCPEC